MTIFLASDHAGFALKKRIVTYLQEEGLEVKDMGAFEFVETDDYPDFISLAAKEVAKNPKEDRGIIIGGSGQGEAIVANRFKGVRAMVYHGGALDIVKISREHNDSNILSIGARFVPETEALKAVDLWLQTEFIGEERHIRRIKKIDEYPNLEK